MTVSGVGPAWQPAQWPTTYRRTIWRTWRRERFSGARSIRSGRLAIFPTCACITCRYSAISVTRPLPLNLPQARDPVQFQATPGCSPGGFSFRDRDSCYRQASEEPAVGLAQSIVFAWAKVMRSERGRRVFHGAGRRSADESGPVVLRRRG